MFCIVKDSQHLKQFWRDREKEIGSTILFHTMVEIKSIQPPGNWSLFYGTSNALFFHFFETKSLFSSLLGRKQTGEESCQKIDVSRIKRVDFYEEKVFLKCIRISEGKIMLTFKDEVFIKNNYKTDVCWLVPIMKVSMLKNLFPRF